MSSPATFQSDDPNVPGVTGIGTLNEGVRGLSHSTHGGVVGINDGQSNGAGVFAVAQTGEGVHAETQSATFAAVTGVNLGQGPGIIGISTQNEGVRGLSHSTHGGVVGVNDGQSNGAGVFGVGQTGEGVHGETQSATFAAVAAINLNPNGTGAGVFAESRGQGPAGFFKGNVLVTGDIQLINADCAEDFDIVELETVEPGAVMVLDRDGRTRVSREAYDKRVVGVVSGGGDYKPGLVLDWRQTGHQRTPIALLGKVYCKVDADYAGIEVGDLLTTSQTPGHAMKASDRAKAFGAIIGKALQPLSNGRGLIPVLVTLQ